MAFGDCQTPPPAPLTPDEICQGFAKCGEPGMRLNPNNMTRIIAYLEALLGVDIDALATALCENAIFQQCVIDLTSSSTHTVESVVALPASAPEGSEFCLTVTIDTPVVGTPLSIPISLLPVDEQLIHNYVIPPFLVIAVGDTEGFVCVTTINDSTDEPDMSLVFALAPTPRLPGWPGGNYAVTVTDNDVTTITAPADTESEGAEGDPLSVTYGTFTTSIGAPPTIAALGLPVGVTFTDNGDGTYTLDGDFPPPPGSSTVVTITATYPGAANASIDHTITTEEAPAVYTVLDTSVTPFPSGGQGTDVCFSLEVFPLVTGASLFVPFDLSGTEQDDNSYPFPATIEIEVGQSVAAFCVTTNDDGTLIDQVLTGTFGTFPEAPSFAGEALSTTLEAEEGGGGGAGAFNPADVDGQITLSGGGTTLTKNSGTGWRSGRSTTGHEGGKYYFEWTPVEFSGSFVAAGLMTAAADLLTYTGAGTTSLGVVTSGDVFMNAVADPTLPAFAEGDTIGMAVDLDAGLFWTRQNGGDWNGSPTADPETGTEGLAMNAAMVTGTPEIFAAVSLQLSPGDQVTVNLGLIAFDDPAPVGFADWG